jgi:phosphoenolpyruvate phosphomutase
VDGGSILERARREGYLVGAGMHNALTARLAEDAGFDVLWLSSLELSTAMLLPDVNVITFVEVARVLREVSRATSLPVIVDADNGYGSDETTVRAGSEFALAGAAAVCIEDNAFPKRNSFYAVADRELEDKECFSHRIGLLRATLPETVDVVARTEGLIAGLGVRPTVERALSYVEAGANGIFVQVNRATVDEFAEVLRSIRAVAPIVVTPTALPEVSAAELHRMGADVVIYSNAVVRTIVAALERSLARLRAEERLSPLDGEIAPLDHVLQLALEPTGAGLPR